MPSGTRIGHNHLHVADLAASRRSYGLLGFVANPAFMGMRRFTGVVAVDPSGNAIAMTGGVT